MQQPKNVSEWSIRQINKYFRDHDDSRMYPVCGRFNVTERAIRRVLRLRREGYGLEGLEYYLAVEAEISNIVNDYKLW